MSILKLRQTPGCCMETKYKLKTYVKNNYTGDVFKITAKRGGFNCRYHVRCLYKTGVSDKFVKDWQYNFVVGGSAWYMWNDLDTHFTQLPTMSVEVLFGNR